MRDKTAIVRVWGGVGNQLFIYAFAKYLSLQYNLSVVLEIRTGFTNDGYGRVYKLPDFRISLPTTGYYYTLFPRVNRQSPFLKRLMFPKATFFEEAIDKPLTHISEDILPSVIKPIIYYQGYWQSINWSGISDQLRIDFDFNVEETTEFSLLKKEIEDTSQISVAIHLRRIEYNTILTLEYYEKAIEHISTIVDHPHFFIFSDDIEWCKNNLDLKNKKHSFVYNFADELYELKLMSLCSHFIIANSTYSWWGAWMSSNKEKTVIIPKDYLDNSCMDGNVVRL